jgi:DNA-binding NtrC family response regulator
MDDLPLLIDHFLVKHTQESSRNVTLDPETKRLLYAHSWPGNVRELENVIERGLVLTTGDIILPEDLPSEIRGMDRSHLSDNGDFEEPTLAKGAKDSKEAKEAKEAKEPEKSNWTSVFLELHPIGTISLTQALMALEEGMVRRAMEKEEGVQAHAADSLGLKRNVFKYKWDKFLGSSPNPLSEEMEQVVPQDALLMDALSRLEETMLKTALEKSYGVQAQAADYLGIRRNILVYKVKKYPNLLRLLKE